MLVTATMQSGPGTSRSTPSTAFGGRQDPFATTLDINDELVNQTAGDYFDGLSLEGQLADGPPHVKQSLSEDYNQLDEPILDTLMRDLTGIYNKMKIMTLPLSSYDIYKVVLKGWDLWGPLMLCTFLALSLHHSENGDKHTGPQFADVFVLVWFGACMVSLNYRLLSLSSVNDDTVQLGSGAGVPQNADPDDTDVARMTSDSVSGRSRMMTSSDDAPYRTLMSPPSILQLVCVFGYCLVAPCFGLIVLKLFSFSSLFFERAIVGLFFGFAWPTYCSIRILVRYQHPDKRALAIYPIGLFYFVLSCMIILNH